MFINKIRNKNNLPIILFFIIVINYIPLILPNVLSKASNGASFISIAICFCVQIILLASIFCKNIDITKEKIKNLKIITFVSIILVIVQIVSFFIGDYKFLDIANIICQFFNIVFLFVCIFDVKVEETNIEKFMKLFVGFGIIACIFNVFLYFKEILNLFIGSNYISIKSFFANRNQFAFFMYIAVISNVFLMLKYNNKKYKLILFIFLINLFFSMSRTGIAITILFLIIMKFSLSDINIKNKIFYLTLFIIFVMMLMLILYFLNPELINQVIRLKSIKNLSGRTAIWEKAIEILTESPLNFLFGVGRFNGIENLVFETKTFTQFHNIYLDFLITGGLVELVFALYVFTTTIKKIAKSNLEFKYKKFYKGIFITYFIYALFESVGRFSIGAVDVLCFIYFVTIPILHAESCSKQNLEKKNI